jgi:hypothetical protein
VAPAAARGISPSGASLLGTPGSLSVSSSPAAARLESVLPVRPPSRDATGPVSSGRDVSATAASPVAMRDPLAAPSAAARSSAPGLAGGTASRPSATRDTEARVECVVKP